MMYTFDNAFQVSFLFRDGCIAFVKDDEGMPAIKPLNQNNKPPKPAENASFTSTLNMGIINVSIDFQSLTIALDLIWTFLFAEIHCEVQHSKGNAGAAPRLIELILPLEKNRFTIWRQSTLRNNDIRKYSFLRYLECECFI